MNIWKAIRPSWLIMLIFAFLITTSAFVVRSSTGTSKVSYDIETGWPMAYLSLTLYYGPCGASGEACNIVLFQGLETGMLILDASIWYLTACIASYGLSLVIPEAKVHAFLTSKR
jgi:hypothetical protein